ncbi:hypothetical protein [Endozoicomonas sp. ONNA1]|uniref:hypothetical protein n=1 Tax=Endozoicomonas sp. ONNA1 TaxID=2828740 RepID=UPI0021480EBF|nr:hypothetical protein [Endozoicomonas sp. ONNA1]
MQKYENEILGLLRHPYAHIPDFLRGSIFDSMARSVYMNMYTTLQQYNPQILPGATVYGDALETVLETNIEKFSSQSDVRQAIGRSVHLRRRQQMSLEERLDIMLKGLSRLQRRNPSLKNSIVTKLFKEAKRGHIPDHHHFQWALFKLAYNMNEDEIDRTLRKLHARITTIL